LTRGSHQASACSGAAIAAAPDFQNNEEVIGALVEEVIVIEVRSSGRGNKRIEAVYSEKYAGSPNQRSSGSGATTN
jgi:hypothetical protein